MDAIITGAIEIPAAIPVSLMREVRRDLTFPNPERLRLLRAGQDVRHLQQTIQVWKELPGGGIEIPRGYGRRLHGLAADLGIPIRWEDRRAEAAGPFPQRLSGVTLRGYQSRAVEQAMVVTQGVVVSPTGSGKTITALEIIRRRGQKALVLVHNRALAKQWRQVIRERLGMEAGIVGDGEWVVGHQVTVAMIQTLASRMDAAQRLGGFFGLVLVDECHHTPAVTFATVIGQFRAKWRYGFTATPNRNDGLAAMIHRLLGDVVAEVAAAEVLSAGGIVPVMVEVARTEIAFEAISSRRHGWTHFVAALAADAERNRRIAAIVAGVAGAGRKVLVLTDRVGHAEALAALIPGAVLAHGQIKGREAVMARMAEAAVTVGTKGLLGEGLDCAVWSCLVMASPMSGETPVRQAVGRIVRPAPGKRDAVVIDVVDDHPFAYGAFRKRRAIYNQNRWLVRGLATEKC
ncbi:MAG: DEAD/DEAH box helicase [Magnetococcales bacterium]|nr:DEAD/DEAH box helicase [Magnetococcales bacterium]